MSKKLYAPQVDYYVNWMGHQDYGFSNNRTTYDVKSYENIDNFFELLKQISPISDNGCRELWFCVEKGTIDKFGDYSEFLDCGEVENYQEFEDLWNDNYPNEQKWYRVEALYDEKVNYKVIVVNYKVVIVVDPNTEKGYENNISELYDKEWIVGKSREQIEDRYGEFKREYVSDTGENVGSYYVNYENSGMDPSYIHDTYFVIFNDEDIAVDAYFRETSIGG